LFETTTGVTNRFQVCVASQLSTEDYLCHKLQLAYKAPISCSTNPELLLLA
uniref:Uncharacterized protein n=1 Tax=Latimeria chalumnae TaxID=7897 RepID=H3AU61_LATCH